MSAPRAYRLRKGDELCGDLGEGPGPFLTAVRSALPAPQLSVARFTSRAPHLEGAVSEALLSAADFEAALRALEGAGFSLEPLPFEQAFGPRGRR